LELEIYEEPSEETRRISQQAAVWRTFNRYYFNRLRRIRAINAGWGFHSTELRVFRELGEAENGVNNAYLAWKVNIDKGQVTRIINFFRHLGWIEEWRDEKDRRIKYFSLTPSARDTFRRLDKRWQDATELFLSYMSETDRARLMAALGEVEDILVHVSSLAVEPRYG